MTILYISPIDFGQKLVSVRTASFLEALRAVLCKANCSTDGAEYQATARASMKERSFRTVAGLLSVSTTVKIRRSARAKCLLDEYFLRQNFDTIPKSSLDELFSLVDQWTEAARQTKTLLPAITQEVSVNNQNWTVEVESIATFAVQQNVQVILSDDRLTQSNNKGQCNDRGRNRWISEFWNESQKDVLKQSVMGVVKRFLCQVEPKILFVDEINERLPELSLQEVQQLLKQCEENSSPWCKSIETSLPIVEWGYRIFNIILNADYKFSTDRIKIELVDAVSSADCNNDSCVLGEVTTFPNKMNQLYIEILERLTWLVPDLAAYRNGGFANVRVAGLVTADELQADNATGYKHVSIQAEILPFVSKSVNVYVIDDNETIHGSQNGWTGPLEVVKEALKGEQIVIHVFDSNEPKLKQLQLLVDMSSQVVVHEIQDPEIGEGITLGLGDIAIHSVKNSAGKIVVSTLVNSVGNARRKLRQSDS